MDAPQHSQARAADLGQFRKWNRVHSYTYGDSNLASQPADAQSTQPSGGLEYRRTVAPPGSGPIPRMGPLLNHRRVESFHELHTLEEDHQGHEDQETQSEVLDAQSEDEGEETAGENDFDDDDGQTVDSDLQDRVHDISFDEESQAFTSADSPLSQDPAISQGEEVVDEDEDEDDDDDDLGHVASSPCVTAEMKRAKNRGLFGKAFKPLSFGKPHGLSLFPSGRLGLNKTGSQAS
jgi:hypothetical protein